MFLLINHYWKPSDRGFLVAFCVYTILGQWRVGKIHVKLSVGYIIPSSSDNFIYQTSVTAAPRFSTHR